MATSTPTISLAERMHALHSERARERSYGSEFHASRAYYWHGIVVRFHRAAQIQND